MSKQNSQLMKKEEYVNITQAIKCYSQSSLSFKNTFIADSTFSLFEAMSAVEIMDPKMDSCSSLDPNEAKNVGDIIKNVRLPPKSSFETSLKLFETLIMYEVSFLEGASVLESTHHCVLLHENSWMNACRDKSYSNPIDEAIDAATVDYCQCMNKSMFYFANAILDADIYEEEDFCADTAGLLIGSVDDNAVIATLQQHIDTIQSAAATTEPTSANTLFVTFIQLRIELFKLYKAVYGWIRANVRQASVALALPSRAHTDSNRHHHQQQQQQTVYDSTSQLEFMALILTTVNAVHTHLEFLLHYIATHTDDKTKTSSTTNNNTPTANTSDSDTAADSSAKDSGKLPLPTQDSERVFYNFCNVQSHKDIPEVAYAYSVNIIKLLQTNPLRSISFKSLRDSLQALKTIMSELICVCSQCETFIKMHHPTAADIDTAASSHTTTAAAAAGSTASVIKDKNVPKKAVKGESVDSTVHSSVTAATASKSPPLQPVPTTATPAVTVTGWHTSLNYDILLHSSLETSRKHMNVLSRSLYRAVIVSYTPHHYMSVLLLNSMRERKIPSDILDFDLVCNQWIYSLCHVVNETLRTLMTTRTKLMTKLDGVLPAWGNAIKEATFIDQQFTHLIANASSAAASASANTATDPVTGTTAGTQDNEPMQEWFVSFILLSTTLLMEVVLELLLEMDLLSVAEIDCLCLYWDYVCSTRSAALEKFRLYAYHDDTCRYQHEIKRMQQHAIQLQQRQQQLQQQLLLQQQQQQQQQQGEAPNKGQTNNNKKGANKSKQQQPPPQTPHQKQLYLDQQQSLLHIQQQQKELQQQLVRLVEPSPPMSSVEELALKAKCLLFKGHFRFLLGCHKLKLINKDTEGVTTPFTSWYRRFDQRFRSFHSIPNPPMLSYEAYQQNAQACYANIATIYEARKNSEQQSVRNNKLIATTAAAVARQSDKEEDDEKAAAAEVGVGVEVMKSSLEYFKRARQFLDLFRVTVTGNKSPAAVAAQQLLQIEAVTHADRVAQQQAPQYLKCMVMGSVSATKAIAVVTSHITAVTDNASTSGNDNGTNSSVPEVDKDSLRQSTSALSLSSQLRLAVTYDSMHFPVFEISAVAKK